MIVYNSMLVLVFILMAVYCTQQPSAKIRHSQPIPWIYAVISMGYIIFWAALRSGFADTRAYIMTYSTCPIGIEAAAEAFNNGGKAPGWALYQILFKTFVSDDFHWWLASIAIFTGIPIMLTFRQKSVDYLFTMFLFISSVTFSWMLNGIRQFLAAAILFGFYYLIIEKKRIWYIGLVLLCSMIHTTALIMLPAVFFIDYKPFGKVMISFIICILLSAFFVGSLLDAMDSILENSLYRNNLDQFANDDGAHPLRVLLESVPLLLAFFKRKQIAALNNSFINLCINMSTVTAGLYFVAMLTSGIMIGRLPIYFELYNFILIPFLINYVYTAKKRLFYFGFYAVYLTFYFLMTSNYYYVSNILGNYF